MSTDNTIQQARLGDDSAWQELVNQHQEAVFRLAYLILGEYDDARDVAQDTFIRAYNKFSHFDANRSLRPVTWELDDLKAVWYWGVD